MDNLEQRLAVCSWSLQPSTPEDLINKVRDTGIRRVQLALDPLRDQPAIWGNTADLFAGAGLTIASGMFGCVGEDYTTLDTIRQTGGIVPDATWEQNQKNAKASALTARQIGIKYITFHAGFIPHEAADPSYKKMLDRLKVIAGIFGAEGITLGFETGQERATDLMGVLNALSLPNVGVNFDPANMLLYDKGHPIEALRMLGPWVRNVHIKDANRTNVPGTWGSEVPAGTGEVDWKAFFATLRDIGFKGDYVIEREAGTQRVADIRTAKEMVRKNAS